MIREELDAAGCQEVLLPALHPIELWEQSGRAALFGSDALPAMTVEARGGTFVLGPTHEEVVTVTVGAEVESYRQLPLTVYQIQVKFRDEARPRFGLLRTRELIMADAYSFDVDKEAMQASYRTVFDAYLRIFARLGLTSTPVEAESGAIGGDVNHEFMVPSAVGEDHFVSLSAPAGTPPMSRRPPGRPQGRRPGGAGATGAAPVVEHHTPGRPGIAEVVSFFADQGIGPADFLKSLAVLDAEGRPTLLLVPGDREARLPSGWRLFEDADFAEHPVPGQGVHRSRSGSRMHGIRVVADVRGGPPGPVGHRGQPGGPPPVGGGPRPRLHRRRLGLVRPGGDRRRLPPLRGGRSSWCARSRRPTPSSWAQVLRGHAGRDLRGRGRRARRSFSMGCYGMGVSRLLAVVAEEHHDDRGLAWPPEVAPFQVHLVALGAGRSPEVAEAADALYERLVDGGVEVLYDDRDVSPGVKFADADLLGVPVRLVVGAKGLARGVVEWRSRATGEERELARGQPGRELASAG